MTSTMTRLRSALLALTAACVLSAPLAAPAAAQTTKLKLVLNWKYQGPQGMFFLADDKGYFKDEGLEVTLDQGNGSGAGVPLVANGTYDVGVRRHQRADRACGEEAGRRADRGLCHVQPAAVHGGGEGRQPDQDAEGFRGQDARRRGQRRRAQAVPGALQAHQDRLHQGQHHQHAAEPARADADAGPGRRRVRLRQHHPLLGQADGRRGQPASLHQLRRLRHGSLFQRHHRLEEAGEGKSEGGRRPRPRDQQGADRLAEGHRRVGRRGRQARAADQGSGREGALRRDAASPR